MKTPDLAGRKVCSVCLTEKPLEEFVRHRRRPDGHGSRCRRCHASDQVCRSRAQRAGTWSPIERSPAPTVEPTEAQIAWAAGFIEGDGAIGVDNTTCRLRADQIYAPPLERLASYFGGRVSTRGRPTPAGNTVYRWAIHGDQARAAMRAIYPWMSPVKQRQINDSLSQRRGPHQDT